MTQPTVPNQICTVANGSGTATADVTNVAVTCVLSYVIGGNVTGVVGTGLTLNDNTTDTLLITKNGAFTFAKLLPTGTAWTVTISAQPTTPSQTCNITPGSGSGTATADVTSIAVTCQAVTFSVGGNIVGLQGKPATPPAQVNLPLTDNSFVLQNNNGDNLTVTHNGTFTFATSIALNGAYNVEVFTGPSTQQQACWTFGYKGVAAGNVTSVTVDCGHDDWEWIAGTKTAGVITAPQYGSFPTAQPPTIPNPYTNTPGARTGGAGWTDNGGNLWLFGGKGWELAGNATPDTLYGNLNDLWECQVVSADTPHCQWQLVSGYDPTTVGGGSSPPTVGSLIISRAQHEGNPAQTSAANALLVVPGSRWGGATWTDASKTKLWLFGGNGNGSQLLNDLWVFDTGTLQWTFKSGSAAGGNIGGTYTGAAYPGSRWGSVTWVDGSGNFWLFGGYGYDKSANVGFLNDLWKFDGTTWTFVAGSQTINPNGVYTGTPQPGGRQQAVGWVDASGNLWLFGGEGEDATGTANGILNDLWMYNITGNTWSFVAGANAANQTGVYPNQTLIGPASVTSAAGTTGLTPTTPGLVPGSRWGATTWTDPAGTLWLMGGWGLDSTGTNGNGALNDLWAFDTTTATWTWVKGSNTGDQNGVYGSLTRPYAPSVTYVPGGRNGATSWVDASGQLWLFGGQGYDSSSADGNGFLNDLWRYVPYP